MKPKGVLINKTAIGPLVLLHNTSHATRAQNDRKKSYERHFVPPPWIMDPPSLDLGLFRKSNRPSRRGGLNLGQLDFLRSPTDPLGGGSWTLYFPESQIGPPKTRGNPVTINLKSINRLTNAICCPFSAHFEGLLDPLPSRGGWTLDFSESPTDPPMLQREGVVVGPWTLKKSEKIHYICRGGCYKMALLGYGINEGIQQHVSSRHVRASKRVVLKNTGLMGTVGW